MVEKLVTISARVKKSQAEEIEKLAYKLGVDKSAVVRELLAIGLKRKKLEEALNLVRERKVTIWKAAEIAGVSYRELLEMLKAYNTPFPLSKEELKVELEEILSS
ncbi:MAG: hypothetical protein DRJ62_05285 [Thermoprotei archaeon]|nr:MAG: hypothetical protein DRJ62_05285 [Thermoprotei archaeon]